MSVARGFSKRLSKTSQNAGLIFRATKRLIRFKAIDRRAAMGAGVDKFLGCITNLYRVG